MKNKLLLILIILTVLQFAFRVFQYRNDYLTKFDAKYWQQRYLHSQWIVPNSKESIGDDGLYAYAGWEYIHGKDPSLLNAELPPLGKYLIGLSEIIFNNQNIFALLCGFFVLISFFILNKIIFKNNFLALLPVTLLSFDPLFYTQLRAPFLDLLFLGLLIMIFIFVLKEKFITACIFLGLMAATKSSATTFILVFLAITVYLFFVKETDKIKKLLFSLPVSLLIFLLTYLRYFLLDHNIIDFLKLQKWILYFYGSGAKGNPLAVWEILFSGKWPNWFGPVQTVSEWNLLWPLASIAVIFYFYKIIPKRKTNKSVLLGLWILIYLAFLTLIPVWPRYLLTALPFLYTLMIWVLSTNTYFKKIIKHWNI